MELGEDVRHVVAHGLGAETDYSADLAPTLQVGLNAYSSNTVGGVPAEYNRREQPEPGDLLVRSEYVRFRRPQVSETDRARIATGKLKARELLAAIGE